MSVPNTIVIEKIKRRTRRRIDYTGCERITTKRISLDLSRLNQQTYSCRIKLNLGDIKLPRGAKVVLETFYGPLRYKRWTLGTVKDADSPKEIHIPFHPSCLRLIVADASGKILAKTSRIRLGEPQSILRVRFDSLGRQVWRTEYDGEGPILIINDGLNENVVKNPAFMGCVFPAVLREILTHIIFVDGIIDTEDPQPEWQGDWLNFTKYILSIEIAEEIVKENLDPEEAENWIEQVVGQFSEFMLKSENWHQLLRILTEAGE